MLQDGAAPVGNGASGVVINGHNTVGPIDNRHNSESVEALKSRVAELERENENLRLQLQAKEAQVQQLLDIIQALSQGKPAGV